MSLTAMKETKVPEPIRISPYWRGFDAVGMQHARQLHERRQQATEAARHRGDHRNIWARLCAWVRENF